MSFRPPKGTDDILPPDSRTWRRVLRAFDDLAERYGYDLIVYPVFDSTEVFERGVGQGTDVVQKEMYTFEDRGGRSITLRPEATASVVRAYLASGSQIAMKLAYAGPMFRYERPQAGRRRQFWQVGVEYLGEDSPAADVEVIELGYRFYEAIGLAGLEVQLNTLGDPSSRAAHREALVSYLTGIEDDLSADSRGRIATNPLRVFDSKEDRHKLSGAPMPFDYLSTESADHYAHVKRGLDQAGVPYVENPLLVRGLDYYTRTVFEYVATDLDVAQNAVGGGGRYDQLAEVLGGRHVPAVGFSLGIDRIVLALGDEADPLPALDAFVVVADEVRRDLAIGLVRDLRSGALRVDMEPTPRSVKAQFKAADRRRAYSAIVVGDEWEAGEVTIRNLATGGEARVSLEAGAIISHIQSGGGARMTYRDTSAGELTAADAGRTVQLAGWADRIRDQGGVMFIDLRDASGIVQIVVDPAVHPEVAEMRREYCISVTGEVAPRPAGSENPDLATGGVEVPVSSLSVLSTARPLPFQLDERTEVDELFRLQYRYLDMRRPNVAANLRARSAAVAAMRRTLNAAGFLDVETPTLIKSTPEGARDVLVPSRLQQGDFYALPQSPQLFKQLLMIGGIERYYQIARCYRDEDFRSDRQLEFSQLDIEGSFWGRDDVLATIEEVMVEVARDVRGVELTTPFPRLTYDESMDRYGTDKPDLRFEMVIEDLTDLFSSTEFKAFAGAVEAGGVIRGLNVGPAGLSRAGLDALVEDAKAAGAGGLVWMVVEDDGGLRSPVAKFLSEDELAGIKSAVSGSPGDLLLLVADRRRIAAEVLGRFRVRFGSPEGHDELNFLWVVDFPVFEETAGGDLVAAHHPFSAPVDVAEMEASPATAVAQAYDLVLNGSELGSGSVRIHDPATQEKVFEILGISAEEAERRFGWFVEALGFGTPPHAGFAVGIARLVSILQGEPNIREVIPFPKTQTGVDPLTGSPSPVDDYQLMELGIDLRPDVRAARLADEESEGDLPEGS